MKKYNLMPKYVRDERIEDNVKPNLLNRNFNTNALNETITKRRYVYALILHSDQRLQYTSYE